MATLKSLVDETSNIKNELVECRTNLKNNLIAKGVECSDTDKMSSLIDKVGNLKSVSINLGDKSVLYSDTVVEMIKPSDYTYFNKEYVFECDGNYRLSSEIQSTSSSAVAYLKMVVLNNNSEVLKEQVFSMNSMTYTEYVFDCSSIKKGYKYKILGKVSNTSYGIRVKSFSVKCNIEFN